MAHQIVNRVAQVAVNAPDASTAFDFTGLPMDPWRWLSAQQLSNLCLDCAHTSRAHGLARCDEGERAFPAAASCWRYFPDSQLDG